MKIRVEGQSYTFPDDATDDEINDALGTPPVPRPTQAPPTPPQVEHPGIGQILKQNLMAVPGRAAADIGGTLKSVGQHIVNPRLPSMATTLPLVAGGPGSSVVSRLGSVAMGAMMDQPSANPLENLLTATKGVALPAAAEALFPLLGKAFQSTGWGRRAINAADAQRVGRAMEEAAPTLRPGTSAAAMQETAQGPGLNRIGQAKEATTTGLEYHLKAAPGETPHFTSATGQGFVRNPSGVGWTPARQQGHIAMPSLGEPSISLRDANARLSEIGDMMRGLKPLDPRFPKDVDLKQLYGAVASDIEKGIKQVLGPGAAATFAEGQADYRAGRFIGDEMLGRPSLFRQGEFNAGDLQRWLKNPDNREALARATGGELKTGTNLDAYNRIVGSITRGAEPGMVDALSGRAPGMLSGRGSYGFWRLPLEGARKVFPNASSSYVGKVPYSTLPPELQTIVDVALQRATP